MNLVPDTAAEPATKHAAPRVWTPTSAVRDAASSRPETASATRQPHLHRPACRPATTSSCAVRSQPRHQGVTRPSVHDYTRGTRMAPPMPLTSLTARFPQDHQGPNQAA